MKEKIKSLFGAQDMTVGKPTSVLIKFIIPLLIGNIAQQLYNTVDSIVVGHYIGDEALAAVGASMPIINLILALFMGVSTGAGIIVAQAFGSKDRAKLSKSVGNVLTMTLIVGIVGMVIGLLLCKPILTVLDTPANIYEGAYSYLMIWMAGFIGCSFYNMGSGILRGVGDSIMPLVYLLLACGLNIVLDIFFVAVIPMGVAGVALATILAQFISAVFCMIKIFKMRDILDLSRGNFIPDKNLCLNVIKIGMPAGLTQAIFSCAALVVQTLTNSFGSEIITTNTIIMRVDGFAMMPNFSFGMAMTTYVGQNIGARKTDRVHNAAKDGLKISLLVCITMTVAILIFGKSLMSIFTDTEYIIDLGSRMLRVMAVGYIGVCITQVLSGIMRGVGDTMTPMIISVISTVIVRVPVAYLLAHLTDHQNPEVLFISLVISWVLGALITIAFYAKGNWKKKGPSL